MNKTDREFMEYCIDTIPQKDKENWFFWVIDNLMEQGDLMKDNCSNVSELDLKKAILFANRNYKPILISRVL